MDQELSLIYWDSESRSEEKAENVNDFSPPFDPTKINVYIQQSTLVNLIGRMKNQEIDMNPDFQRNGELWSDVEMSRLIESILIRFPLPSFCFDCTDENKWVIVDGLQRLSSIRRFVLDKDRPLKLKGLEFLKELEGMTYGEISRMYQRLIDECTITSIQINPGTPDEVKYSIFKRINTGGLILNAQEIRNAIAGKKSRCFLNDLAGDSNLIAIFGEGAKRRMGTQELVLRFVAFYLKDFETSRKDIKAFLDEAMLDLEKLSSMELEELSLKFRVAINACYSIFEDVAFVKRNTVRTTRQKNTALYEVWMTELAKCSLAQIEALIKGKNYLKKIFDEEQKEGTQFFNAISFATLKGESFHVRHEVVKSIIERTLKHANSS